VFDLRGRLVHQFAAGHREAGTYEFTWRGDDPAGRRVAAGTYLIRLEHAGRAGRTVESRKVVMLP
jgi:flagellar hook assembly protein FlgD